MRQKTIVGVLVTLWMVVAAHAQDLAGRVVEDSSGEAVASAELKIHKAGMRELVADLETDRAGKFTGTELAAGDYTVDVSKPNFIPTAFPLHIPNRNVQLRLLRYAVMDGRVTNVRGEAVAGRVLAPGGRTNGATRMTVLQKQPGSEEFRLFRDTAPEDGHYRFFDLPPGQYKLGMWFYGLNEGAGMQMYPDNANPKVFTVAGGEVFDNLNFLITPNTQYSVSGTLELPAPGLTFQLALGIPDQPTLPVAQTLVKDDGSFSFDKVPAGTYDLFASGPANGYTAYESVLGGKGGDPLFGRVRIQVAGVLTGVAVPLGPARSMGVVLRAHGQASMPPACPQSVTVALTSLEPWAIAFFSASAQVSAGKEQTIKGLPPGKFRVMANGLGAGCYQVNQPEAIPGQDSQPVAVEVAAAGSIRGVVRGGSDLVVLLLDSSNGAEFPTQLAFPDAQGSFGFATLAPGRYRIAAQHAAAGPKARWVANISQMREIEVAAGDPTSVELAAPPASGGQ